MLIGRYGGAKLTIALTPSNHPQDHSALNNLRVAFTQSKHIGPARAIVVMKKTVFHQIHNNNF
ncbi:hypothetical protein BGC07_17700 [Piscirickettsia litoralis]|uniref:Uncharacterized protein n=1 Tax=Piscirickettsia litoralis TaxID=1891921 RepID=A0ABX3A0X8_9GAMM|nr:hypothetical protein BGC07_17700 [Piscirickettsia litoralis]